jgi:hypothetical protein
MSDTYSVRSDPAPRPSGPDDAWSDGLTDAQRADCAKRLADWFLQQGDLVRARGWLRLAAEYRRFDADGAALDRSARREIVADVQSTLDAVEGLGAAAIVALTTDLERATGDQFHSFHPEIEPRPASRLRLSLLKAEVEKAARLRDIPRLQRAQARLEALQQAP